MLAERNKSEFDLRYIVFFRRLAGENLRYGTIGLFLGYKGLTVLKFRG